MGARGQTKTPDAHLLRPAPDPGGAARQSPRLQSAQGLDILIVDYLQLMKGDGRNANRQEEVAAISRELKILAGELRESGAIENDANVVMFLFRPNRDEQTSVAKFAKNRSGKTGKQDLRFEATNCRFVE